MFFLGNWSGSSPPWHVFTLFLLLVWLYTHFLSTGLSWCILPSGNPHGKNDMSERRFVKSKDEFMDLGIRLKNRSTEVIFSDILPVQSIWIVKICKGWGGDQLCTGEGLSKEDTKMAFERGQLFGLDYLWWDSENTSIFSTDLVGPLVYPLNWVRRQEPQLAERLNFDLWITTRAVLWWDTGVPQIWDETQEDWGQSLCCGDLVIDWSSKGGRVNSKGEIVTSGEVIGRLDGVKNGHLI